MAKLLNQKYLGFLEWILHEITEFIELACGPNLKGEVSAQKKQWIANLMAESAPLVYQHSLVGKASTLGKMLKYGMAPPSAEEVRKGSVVYARWNLTNDVTYVGETGKWEQRVGQHYMKTRSHEMGSDKPCSGCAEHAEYLKHRPVSAACWFMTPVRVCASKSEAELLEQKIERAINPVLNRMARKFPIEQNYVMLERKQNLKRRAEGKQRAELWYRPKFTRKATVTPRRSARHTAEPTRGHGRYARSWPTQTACGGNPRSQRLPGCRVAA